MDNDKNLYICESNITSAWIKAVTILRDRPKMEAFNLSVRIENPTTESPSQREVIERYLEEHVDKWQKDHIQMVAQTIFPHGLLYKYCPDPENLDQRQQFYNRYMKNKNYIRAENPQGTYFQRLIWWPLWDTHERIRVNQIENIIRKINTGKASRVVHEIAIENPLVEGIGGAMLYNPDTDKNHSIYMSFPCLSYISVKPESGAKTGGKIHMTAVYRNHYFINRAYGNYLGLGLLLNFISNATGRKPGELFCVSSLVKLEAPPHGLSKEKVNEMLKTLRKSEV